MNAKKCVHIFSLLLRPGAVPPLLPASISFTSLSLNFVYKFILYYILSVVNVEKLHVNDILHPFLPPAYDLRLQKMAQLHKRHFLSANFVSIRRKLPQSILLLAVIKRA